MHLSGIDTTNDTPDASESGIARTSAQAGSLTLTVWPDEPVGDHQRYAYRIHDITTGQTTSGRDLFTGVGAHVEPGRAIRDLAGFLAVSGRARQGALNTPGLTPESSGLFPDGVVESARANLDQLTLLAENGPQPDQTTKGPASRRWVSVVFLQGDDADQVLDLLERDGADEAIKHLAGYDYGEETTQAALENGYVYDTPPAGVLDRTASHGRYALTYNPRVGYVNLLRAYDAPVEATQGRPGPAASAYELAPTRRAGRAADRPAARVSTALPVERRSSSRSAPGWSL